MKTRLNKLNLPPPFDLGTDDFNGLWDLRKTWLDTDVEDSKCLAPDFSAPEGTQLYSGEQAFLTYTPAGVRFCGGGYLNGGTSKSRGLYLCPKANLYSGTVYIVFKCHAFPADKTMLLFRGGAGNYNSTIRTLAVGINTSGSLIAGYELFSTFYEYSGLAAPLKLNRTYVAAVKNNYKTNTVSLFVNGNAAGELTLDSGYCMVSEGINHGGKIAAYLNNTTGYGWQTCDSVFDWTLSAFAYTGTNGTTAVTETQIANNSRRLLQIYGG